VQHGHLVGQIKHHLHVVLDEQHSQADGEFAQLAHEGLGLAAAHTRRGLVEQNHTRRGGQHHAQLQQTLLGITQLRGQGVGAGLQAQCVQQVIDAFAHRRLGVYRTPQPAPAARVGSELAQAGAAQVVAHRQARKQLADLKAA
jgi:hypothetical protein